jgi:hypothetical protein
MSDQTVQQLTLQLNASVELARQELATLRGSMDQVDRKAGETQGRLENAFAGVEKAAGLAKVAVAGFLSAFSVSAVLGFARSILQMADDLSTAADQAGVGVERFQTLKEGLRALEVSGENVGKSLQRLTQVLGEVQSGSASKQTEAALERLGVLSKILNGEIANTEQLFDAVAAAAGRYNSTAQFTADLTALVGRRAGAELAAALKDGGAALNRLEKVLRAAGDVMSEDLLKRLADINERLDQLKSRGEIKLTLLAGDFLNVLDAVNKALEGSSLWKAFLFPNPGVQAAAGIGVLIKAREQLAATGAVDPRRRAEATLAQVAPGTALYESLYADFVRRFGEDPEIGVSASRLGPVVARSGGGGGGAGRRGAPAGPTAAQIRNTATAVSGLDAARLSLSSNLDALPSPEALEALRVSISEVDIAAARIRSEPLFGERELFVAAGLAEDIAASISGAVVFGNNLGDALANSFKRAGAALIASGILRLLGGVGEKLLPGFGSIFGGFRENGGPVSPGKAYVVGEKRPELFIPSVPGTILPSVGGGGSSVTVNVDARGAGDPATVEQVARRAVLEAAPAIVEASRAETIKSLRQPMLPGRRR